MAALVPGPGEVGRLVPAVSGVLQASDDAPVGVGALVLAERRRARPGEGRARLELQLVPGDVIGPGGQGLGEVGLEVVGGLAGDAEDQVDAEILEAGRARAGHQLPGLVRRGRPVEGGEEAGLERLDAEREPRDPGPPQRRQGRPVHRFGVRLDADLRPGGQEGPDPVHQGRQPARAHQRGRAAAQVHRFEGADQSGAGLALQLGEQRPEVGVAPAQRAHVDDEGAVPAARRAEGQVQVQVADAGARGHYLPPFPSSPIFSTDRNASCGTSTDPTCFIRFFPSF